MQSSKSNSSKKFPWQKENEEILVAIKQHPFILAKSFLKILPFLVISLYILIVFDQPILVITMFLIFVAGLSYLFYQWILWQKNLVFLTNLKVVNFSAGKLFYQAPGEAYLDQIIDISYEIKGVLPVLFNYGNLKIISKGNEINIFNIKNPSKLKDQILEIIKEINLNQKKAEAQDLLELINKIKK